MITEDYKGKLFLARFSRGHWIFIGHSKTSAIVKCGRQAAMRLHHDLQMKHDLEYRAKTKDGMSKR